MSQVLRRIISSKMNAMAIAPLTLMVIGAGSRLVQAGPPIGVEDPNLPYCDGPYWVLIDPCSNGQKDCPVGKNCALTEYQVGGPMGEWRSTCLCE